MNRLALAVAVLIAAAPLAAHAAEPLEFTVEPKTSYTFDADVADVSLAVFRGGLTATAASKVSEGTTLSLRGDAEYSRYEFDGDTAADPTGDYLRFALRPTASVFLSPEFGLFGGAYVEVGGETGASLSNAYTYGGFAGVNYKLAEGLWIGGGVGYETQLEESNYFYPLVNAYWQIAPQWSLVVDGVGARLSYEATDTCTVFLDARYETREYRVADGPLDGGVLSDDGVPLLLGVQYKRDDTFQATLAGGAVVYRNVRLTDSDDNDLIDESADPTAIVMASLEWKF